MGSSPAPLSGNLASLAQTISINMSVRNSFEEGHPHFCMNRKPPTMLLWYDTNSRPRGAFVFLVLLSFGETSGPNAMPRRMIGMSPKKSVLGLVLMICAAKGQFCIDPRSWLKELLGSAVPTLSSSGDRTTGVPMHHHRTRYSSQDSTKDSNIEQRTALPSTHKAGPETLSFHARRALFSRKALNSGTSWESWRKQRKLPSLVHDGSGILLPLPKRKLS
jgi:hypothetical protein